MPQDALQGEKWTQVNNQFLKQLKQTLPHNLLQAVAVEQLIDHDRMRAGHMVAQPRRPEGELPPLGEVLQQHAILPHLQSAGASCYKRCSR